MGQSVRNVLVLYACLFLRAFPLSLDSFDASVLLQIWTSFVQFFALRLDGAPYGRGVAILLPYVFRAYWALIVIVHCF